ncbi:ribonuclease H family protein, partial [Ascoidea rubescens DSM 1968]
MAKKGFYAVRRGYKTGIFKTWEECQAQINGYSCSEFKKFSTQAEALGYLKTSSREKSFTTHPISKPVSKVRYNYGKTIDNDVKNNEKILRYQNIVPKVISFESSTSLYKSPVNSYDDSVSSYENEHIYTDGASKGNGKEGAKAGFGCFFGMGDPRNHYGKVVGQQTNQRAELSAILHALKVVDQELSDGAKKCYTIFSDSKYSISCIDSWSLSWEKNGWKKATGQKIINLDIIKSAVALKKSINEKCKQAGKPSLAFCHVRGHIGVFGNEQA